MIQQSNGIGNPPYCLLYTAENKPLQNGTKAPPFLFKALLITNLPKSIIEEFKPVEGTFCKPRTDHTIRHVIVSTGSGTGLAEIIWTDLVKPVLEYPGLDLKEQCKVHSTTSETSVSELTESVILRGANEGVPQSIILLSGDGGIVDIVNTLLSAERSPKYRKPAISLLPLGTGNALANSSGIASDNTMGLSTMLRGSPKEIPLFRATFSTGARLLVNEGREEQHLQGMIDGFPVAHGAVVCSWAHHAALVADSDTAEYRKFGSERFKMAAKEALFPSDGSPPHAYKGRVSVLRPGETQWEVISRDEHGYVLATFVSQLEAGFTISPDSKPLDGKLRLVHFGNLDGQTAMEVMTKAFQGGKHVEDDSVGYEEIEGLRIDFDEEDGRWRRVCIDGKIIRAERGGWVEVRSDVEGVVDLMCKS